MCVTIYLRAFGQIILKLFYVCLKITHRVDIEKIIKQAESYSVDIANKTVGVHLKQIIIHLLSIVHSFYSKTDIKGSIKGSIAFTPKQT